LPSAAWTFTGATELLRKASFHEMECRVSLPESQELGVYSVGGGLAFDWHRDNPTDEWSERLKEPSGAHTRCQPIPGEPRGGV